MQWNWEIKATSEDGKQLFMGELTPPFGNDGTSPSEVDIMSLVKDIALLIKDATQ